jgi:hypothetical protein
MTAWHGWKRPTRDKRHPWRESPPWRAFQLSIQIQWCFVSLWIYSGGIIWAKRWIFAIITASAPRTNSLSLQQAPQDYNGSNHVPTDTSSPLNYLKKYGKTHLEMMENRTLITKSCYCHVYARWHRGTDLCAQGLGRSNLEHARM